MPNIRSYDDAHEFLHTRGKAVPRKKVANNTYLERRTLPHDVDGIALKLHNTDVVTWSHDGLVILNTGGWLTVTTKARINDVLPAGWHLVSNRGTWFLQNGWREASKSYRYQDGIQMRHGWDGWDCIVATACPESQAEKDDRHNAAMRKLIGTYLKRFGTLTETAYEPNDCTLCRQAALEPLANGRSRIVTYGDRMADSQHLIDHMLDGVLPGGLISAALTEKGYLPHPSHGESTVKRVLRAYLSARLFVGATAPVHGRHPLPLTPAGV